MIIIYFHLEDSSSGGHKALLRRAWCPNQEALKAYPEGLSPLLLPFLVLPPSNFFLAAHMDVRIGVDQACCSKPEASSGVVRHLGLLNHYLREKVQSVLLLSLTVYAFADQHGRAPCLTCHQTPGTSQEACGYFPTIPMPMAAPFNNAVLF